LSNRLKLTLDPLFRAESKHGQTGIFHVLDRESHAAFQLQWRLINQLYQLADCFLFLI